MGNCQTCMNQRWGSDLATLINLQNIEEYLQQKTAQIHEIILEDSLKTKNKFQNKLQEERTKTNQLYETIKKQIGQKKLKRYAKAQQKTIDQVMGLKNIQKRYDELYEIFESQFQEQKKFAMDTASENRDAMKRKIDLEKPHLHFYHNLPTTERRYLVKQVQDQYSDNMRQQQRQYMQQIAQKLNPKQFLQMLDGIDPNYKIMDVSRSAEINAHHMKKTIKYSGCL